jgi:hypothetical protein
MPGPNPLRKCIPCTQKSREERRKQGKGDKNTEVTWGGSRILPDGSVLYAKTGFEPPPDLEGFVRDPENAWHFLPLWPKCKKRIQTQLVKQCGAISVLSVCAHSGCPFKQQEVSLADCQGCLLRIE